MNFDIKTSREVLDMASQRWDAVAADHSDIISDWLGDLNGVEAPGNSTSEAATAFAYKGELLDALSETRRVVDRVLDGIATNLHKTEDLYQKTEDEAKDEVWRIWGGLGEIPAGTQAAHESQGVLLDFSTGSLSAGMPGFDEIDTTWDQQELQQAIRTLDTSYFTDTEYVLQVMVDTLLDVTGVITDLKTLQGDWTPVVKLGKGISLLGAAYSEIESWHTTDGHALLSGWEGEAAGAFAVYGNAVRSWYRSDVAAPIVTAGDKLWIDAESAIEGQQALCGVVVKVTEEVASVNGYVAQTLSFLRQWNVAKDDWQALLVLAEAAKWIFFSVSKLFSAIETTALILENLLQAMRQHISGGPHTLQAVSPPTVG